MDRRSTAEFGTFGMIQSYHIAYVLSGTPVSYVSSVRGRHMYHTFGLNSEKFEKYEFQHIENPNRLEPLKSYFHIYNLPEMGNLYEKA